jgi:hypothetical protein
MTSDVLMLFDGKWRAYARGLFCRDVRGEGVLMKRLDGWRYSVAVVAGCAVLVLAPLTAARAQTMGEYGATMNAAAGSGLGAGALRVSPPNPLAPSGPQAGGSSGTHTEIIRDYSDPNPRDRQSTSDDQTQDSDGAHADWEQVK